jgi:hypothetical protein
LRCETLRIEVERRPNSARHTTHYLLPHEVKRSRVVVSGRSRFNQWQQPVGQPMTNLGCNNTHVNRQIQSANQGIMTPSTEMHNHITSASQILRKSCREGRIVHYTFVQPNSHPYSSSIVPPILSSVLERRSKPTRKSMSI